MCHIADDYVVEVAVAEVRTYANEYDTDSENDFSDREDEDITLTTVSDPGGQFVPIFAWIFNNLIEKDTFKHRLKVIWKFLELFHFRIEKRGVLIVSIFDLILEFTLYVSF